MIVNLTINFDNDLDLLIDESFDSVAVTWLAVFQDGVGHFNGCFECAIVLVILFVQVFAEGVTAVAVALYDTFECLLQLLANLRLFRISGMFRVSGNQMCHL